MTEKNNNLAADDRAVEPIRAPKSPETRRLWAHEDRRGFHGPMTGGHKGPPKHSDLTKVNA